MSTEPQAQNKITSILIWLSITAFYCYQYILRTLPNIIMPEMMSKYSIGAAEFGSFSGIYYISYIIVHIPIGILLSRFSGKIILPLCVFITAVGLAPLIYFDSWEYVIIGRILTGIGSSAAIVGALQIFRTIYPDKFSRMLGFTVFFGLITVVFIGGILTRLIKTAGVSVTMNILFYAGIILSIITFFLMPKSTSEVTGTNTLSDIKAVITNPQLVLTGIFAGLMIGPLEGFADAWGSAFLGAVYGIGKTTADYYTLSIYLGMCIGCIILPYFADKTDRHVEITILSGFVMILCFIYILSTKANIDALYYICIITGIFCAYQVVIITKIATFVPENLSGTAAALSNMIITAFGWVFHRLISGNMERLWDGTVIEDVRIYSAQAYINSIAIIPAAILPAVLGLYFIMRNIKRLA